MVAPRGPALNAPPGQEWYHDDSCGERLVIRDDTLTASTGLFCPRCNFSPDMQSIALRPVGSTRGLRCSCTAATDPCARLSNGERRHRHACPRRCKEEFEGTCCVRPIDHEGSHWDGSWEGHDHAIVCGPSSSLDSIPTTKRFGRVPRYGADIHDPEARVTRDAFDRHLAETSVPELELAFKEQERVMLSASEWLDIIEAELERRRKQ